MINLRALAAFGLLLFAAPAAAHHSFAAEFDIEKPIELRGTLTGMDWVNPHGWLYIDVMNPDGTVTNWAIEAGGATQLLRRGLRKTDFPAGNGGDRQGLSRAQRGAGGQRPERDHAGWEEFLPWVRFELTLRYRSGFLEQLGNSSRTG